MKATNIMPATESMEATMTKTEFQTTYAVGAAHV